jgi:putative redox protein
MATMKKVQIEAKMGPAFTIESTIRDHRVYVDQPKTGGGEDKGPTPLEYLFLALGSCICSIGRIVANQRKINLRGMEVTMEGELDLEGLLGKNHEAKAGFTGIKVFARIDADMSKVEKEKFLQEIDRRCPVSDNLCKLTPVSLEVAE